MKTESITPLTLQQVFDNALFGVLKQGGPSTDACGKCVYLSPEGYSCGIGQSIVAAGLYDSGMDTDNDTDISTVLRKFAGVAALFAGVETCVLTELQIIHDDGVAEPGFMSAFERLMALFARAHGLIYSTTL